MKKVLLGLMTVVLITMVASLGAKAQTAAGFKIGLFNAEEMIPYLPEYKRVDSLIQQFQRDSIGAKRDFYESEFKRLDSTYTSDSTAKKPASRLELIANQRGQMLQYLYNWQNIAQQASQQKYVQLAQPLYAKIQKALQKVCTEKHISIVLKPESVEAAFPPSTTYVVELGLPVAKELGLKLNDNAGGK